jgi:hypothetical protein
MGSTFVGCDDFPHQATIMSKGQTCRATERLIDGIGDGL